MRSQIVELTSVCGGSSQRNMARFNLLETRHLLLFAVLKDLKIGSGETAYVLACFIGDHGRYLH